jgi:hypothetical protein
LGWPMPFKPHKHRANYVSQYTVFLYFPSKTLYPLGIRTQIFCSKGGCDDHCATPPKNEKDHWRPGMV